MKASMMSALLAAALLADGATAQRPPLGSRGSPGEGSRGRGGRGGEAANPNRPMSMQDFVAQFPVLFSDVVLPTGFPPQRVFSTLDINNNRAIDPNEMKNARGDIQRMLKNHEHNPNKPPGAANPAATADRKGPPTAAERAVMKKEAMDRAEKAKEAAKQRAQRSKAGNMPSPPVPEGNELTMDQFIKRAQQRSPDADPAELFRSVDTDKNGGLSSQEMRKYYVETADAAKAANAPERQGGVKANHPWGKKAKEMRNANQNREISFQEFESRYKGQLSSKEDPHGHHKKFMELDKDGNLRLSKQEMGLFMKEL